MPELAEVEYFRKVWDRGRGGQVRGVHCHSSARVFRGTTTALMERELRGSVLKSSEGFGKRILFEFSGGVWLGMHLGMTGRLRVEPPDFRPGRHDHLALVQAESTLVFSDPRQFGRIQFARGQERPPWWQNLPPAILSAEFTRHRVAAFLRSHGRLPIKAALMLQDGFPGVGNWMADEILWRAHLPPGKKAGALTVVQQQALWRTTRWVARRALETIGHDYSDPPQGWLLHKRWIPGESCPIHPRMVLRREEIGGRTSVWCAICQGRRGRTTGI